MLMLTKKIRSFVALAMAVIVLNGCLFGGSLSVSTFEGIVSMSVGNVDLGTCFEDIGEDTFLCFPDDVFSSTFQTLTRAELLVRLILLDPLVLQLPAGASNFAGSFSHTGTGTSGALDITPGLASIRIDLARTLVAEPGMQLVVIGLPAGAPTTGRFSFNLNFRVPPGTTSLPVKPIITGLVQLTDGSTFYPPIVPCVESMAAAPSLTIPLPAPGDTFTIPRPPNLGCRNVRYDYVGADVPGSAVIPALAPSLLVALAALLGGAGAYGIRRRRGG